MDKNTTKNDRKDQVSESEVTQKEISEFLAEIKKLAEKERQKEKNFNEGNK